MILQMLDLLVAEWTGYIGIGGVLSQLMFLTSLLILGFEITELTLEHSAGVEDAHMILQILHCFPTFLTNFLFVIVFR